jgi:hypothetical protein
MRRDILGFASCNWEYNHDKLKSGIRNPGQDSNPDLRNTKEH